MLRYMAFVWEEADASQAEAARLLADRLQSTAGIWSEALRVPGLCVFHAGARTGSLEVNRLGDAPGVVLGTVFEACTPRSESALPKQSFPAAQAQRILLSGCRTLIDECWGRYVAFAHDATERTSFVLRDPTGGLPCYRTSSRGVELYFSCVEDVVRLGLVSLSINWDFIAARVVYVFLRGRETALKEVTEVMAGERVEIRPGAGGPTVTYTSAWDPLRISQTDVIEDADIAARELRRVTRTCIHSWATCYASILHRLSGGLDSSIVLGCLRDAPSRPSLTCLNYHSVGSNSDERDFARLAAGHAAVRLLERARDDDIRLEALLHINRSVAPTFYLGSLQASRADAALAREVGAAAYFDGMGGDQLFYQAQGELCAADYLRLHGFDRRFIHVALDAAHLERRSIWDVMKQAWMHRLRRRTFSPDDAAPSHRKLVADAALARPVERKRFMPPLPGATRMTPPGKLWHAIGLTIPLEFYDPLGVPGDPEPVHPLMSQPLVELCLRIPTYVLANSGWDRAVARRAFREEVPGEILRRRSKGGMEDHVRHVLARNRGIARELLLDGYLVAAGLLDRRRVDEVLSDRPATIAGAGGEIFDHLSVEAWLRSWQGIATSPAASPTLDDVRADGPADGVGIHGIVTEN